METEYLVLRPIDYRLLFFVIELSWIEPVLQKISRTASM